MDYLSPLFNETAYCMSVERLLGIEAPPRAQTIRLILMELNRISSHLVSLAAGGLEIGALTAMTMGFREREQILDVFELVTGLRMNHGYVRPGGVRGRTCRPAPTRRSGSWSATSTASCRSTASCSPASRSGRTGSRAPATCPSRAASRSA